MRDKRRFRVLEWGKNLLILLLAAGLVYQLVRIQSLNGLRDILPAGVSGSSGAAPVRSAGAVHPARLAVCQNGNRYGVQYDAEETDAAFSTLSTLLSEALGSAGAPAAVPEQTWRAALTGTGVYVDLYYPVPLTVLSCWLGEGQGNSALTGSARRICLTAEQDGGVSLLYINEDDGLYYTCATTLSRSIHLDGAVSGYSPNGALFAFETPGMEALDPYTLLTGAPQIAVCAASNPLLGDSGRVAELLSALSFPGQSAALDSAAGGQVGGGNDSLRLSANGQVTFHTIVGADFRFPVPEDDVQAALDLTQELALATAGAWCGDAKLCLAGVARSGDALEITFQYSLNGAPVTLPEGQSAARFVVRGGAVTDFTLFLRTYVNTEETSPVLPEYLAAAAMEAESVRGEELTLLYEDSGGETVSAGWAALRHA